MKILITFFVLFFSLSVGAQTYQCVNGTMYYYTESDDILSKHKKNDLKLLIDNKNKILKYGDNEFENYNENNGVVSASTKAEIKTLKMTMLIEVKFNKKTKKLIWYQKSEQGFILEGVHAITINHDCT